LTWCYALNTGAFDLLWLCGCVRQRCPYAIGCAEYEPKFASEASESGSEGQPRYTLTVDMNTYRRVNGSSCLHAASTSQGT